MMEQGDVISHPQMCLEEGTSLQRGMNFRARGKVSVILMSLRRGAPYADRIENEGRILIYEGHDIARRKAGSDPKSVDQPSAYPSGKPTENGFFHQAALDFKQRKRPPELVKVYEKLKPGIWVFNGIFKLVDAWTEVSNARKVFKFKLELLDSVGEKSRWENADLDHSRLIPSSVKLEVWKRDKGRCVKCGCKDNLHFDHIIPYSKGGSSLVAENIQLLCARHNLAKRANIE